MKTLYANEIVLFSISWMYIFRNIFRKVYSVLHNWIEKGVTQTEVHYIKRKLMALQDLIDRHNSRRTFDWKNGAALRF